MTTASWSRWRIRTGPGGTPPESPRASPCSVRRVAGAAAGRTSSRRPLPAAGLALVDELATSGSLSHYFLLPATRADLLRRLGRREDAAASYTEALRLVTTGPERRFLSRRLAEVGG